MTTVAYASVYSRTEYRDRSQIYGMSDPSRYHLITSAQLKKDGLYEDIASAILTNAEFRGSSSLFLFNPDIYSSPDFAGNFLVLTAGPGADYRRPTFKEDKFNNETASALFVRRDQGSLLPDARLSATDLLRNDVQKEIDKLLDPLGFDVNLDVFGANVDIAELSIKRTSSCHFSGVFFPANKPGLSSNEAYMKVSADFHIHLPTVFMPNYDVTIALYLSVGIGAKNGKLVVQVEHVTASIEDNIMSEMLEDILNSFLASLEDPVNQAIRNEISKMAVNPADVYLLPGRLLGAAGSGSETGSTYQDVTLAIEAF